MKIFEIKDTSNDKSYYVWHKEDFCKEFGLTRRLLDMTYHQKRNHHKGFVLVNRGIEFIPHPDGDKELQGSGIKGHIVHVTKEESKGVKEPLYVYNHEEEDKAYIKSLEKKVQDLMDKNRILRRHKRSEFRAETVADNFFDEVANSIKNMKEYDSSPSYKVAKSKSSNKKVGIIQLSDLHIGAVVDIPNNKYNTQVCRDRMEKYANKCIEAFEKEGVHTVIIALTGDLYNLDAKLDMLLSMEFNRGESFIHGVDILSDLINRFLEEAFEVKLVGVSGNESRVNAEEYHTNLDSISTNNFDAMAYKVLERLFKNKVEFLNSCDTLNYILNVNGNNILMTHGDKIRSHTDNEINKFRASMVEMFNTPIDYMIFGHIHSTMITPNYARAGSLMGANSYSQIALAISGSVASQNIHIVSDRVTTIQIVVD